MIWGLNWLQVAVKKGYKRCKMVKNGEKRLFGYSSLKKFIINKACRIDLNSYLEESHLV